MHEILSLALVLLGYTSPLAYSHLNLWIMWSRPSVQKKMVFPSANKIFSHQSGVGIFNAFSLQGCTIFFCLFVLPTVQSNSSAVLMQADSMPERCVEWQNSAGRQGLQGSTAPSLRGEYSSDCTYVEKLFPTAQWGMLQSTPQFQGAPWEAPGQRQWPPLLWANTFTPFSHLACACGRRSFGSSTALSEAHLWVPSMPFLGTAGAGRGTDFTHTGTACPTWQLALPWPTSTTMGTHTHWASVLQFSAGLEEKLAYWCREMLINNMNIRHHLFWWGSWGPT